MVLICMISKKGHPGTCYTVHTCICNSGLGLLRIHYNYAGYQNPSMFLSTRRISSFILGIYLFMVFENAPAVLPYKYQHQQVHAYNHVETLNSTIHFDNTIIVRICLILG